MLLWGILLGIFLCILGGVGLSIQNANKPVEILENEDEVAKKTEAYERWNKRRERSSSMLFAGVAAIFICVILLVLISALNRR
jgi:tetrahydromethanopterin S-methyltransferase subunit G